MFMLFEKINIAHKQQVRLRKASPRRRYLPEYTESGDLILPRNFREWVYVGWRPPQRSAMTSAVSTPKVAPLMPSRVRLADQTRIVRRIDEQILCLVGTVADH
jgi:hypothetical protein